MSDTGKHSDERRAYTVVGGDKDQIVAGRLEQRVAIVEEEALGAEDVSSTKDPEENGEVLDLTADGGAGDSDIEEETILAPRLEVGDDGVRNWGLVSMNE